MTVTQIERLKKFMDEFSAAPEGVRNETRAVLLAYLAGCLDGEPQNPADTKGAK